MKVILEERGDRERLERFVEEAQVTGQLEHPNIVPVHELGVDQDGKAYLKAGQIASDKEIWYMEQLLQGMIGQSSAK